MSQRSQIFVRFYNETQKREILGRYYGWNLQERMISRARHSIEWLLAYRTDSILTPNMIRTKLVRILDTNFDKKDVCISSDTVKEYVSLKMQGEGTSLNEHLFYHDNNDGKLLIDINHDNVKYAFISSDNEYLGDGDSYMKWDCQCHEKGWDVPTEWFTYEDVGICKNNIRYLKDNAILLSPEEVDNFLETDYGWQISEMETI